MPSYSEIRPPKTVFLRFRLQSFGQKYWDTSLNYLILVFQEHLPHVYKIKHLAMRSAFTTFVEKMGNFEELN